MEVECFNCGQTGHESWECPNSHKSGNDDSGENGEPRNRGYRSGGRDGFRRNDRSGFRGRGRRGRSRDRDRSNWNDNKDWKSGGCNWRNYYRKREDYRKQNDYKNYDEEKNERSSNENEYSTYDEKKDSFEPEYSRYDSNGGKSNNYDNDRRDGGRFRGTCHNCGQEGHKSFECPEKRGGRGGSDRSGVFGLYDNPNDRDYEGNVNQITQKFERDLTSEEEKKIFQNYSKGLDFEKYDDIDVRRYGKNIPHEIDTFDEQDYHRLLWENIKRTGYTVPTPIQKNCIPIMMKERDMMGCAETGSGKTAAFLIPIVDTLLKEGIQNDRRSRRPEALIVAPTRELAQQIHKEALKFCYKTGLKTSCVFGGIRSSLQERVLDGTNILVATPGRLHDMCNRDVINLSNIRHFVLDEGDRMCDMGFLPQIEETVRAGMTDKGERTTTLFSATFPKKIRSTAKRLLNSDFVFVAVGKIGSVADSISQEIIQCHGFREKNAELGDIFRSEKYDGALVFCNRSKTAEDLFYEYKDTYSCDFIYGRLSQRRRDQAIRSLRNRDIQILFTTDVLGRGIDIGHVGIVVNFDLPKKSEDYVHRIGRTGRVGHRGKSFSFFSWENNSSAHYLIKVMKESGTDEKDIPQFLFDAEREQKGESVNKGGETWKSNDKWQKDKWNSKEKWNNNNKKWDNDKNWNNNSSWKKNWKDDNQDDWKKNEREEQEEKKEVKKEEKNNRKDESEESEEEGFFDDDDHSPPKKRQDSSEEEKKQEKEEREEEEEKDVDDEPSHQNNDDDDDDDDDDENEKNEKKEDEDSDNDLFDR